MIGKIKRVQYVCFTCTNCSLFTRIIPFNSRTGSKINSGIHLLILQRINYKRCYQLPMWQTMVKIQRRKNKGSIVVWTSSSIVYFSLKETAQVFCLCSTCEGCFILLYLPTVYNHDWILKDKGCLQEISRSLCCGS